MSTQTVRYGRGASAAIPRRPGSNPGRYDFIQVWGTDGVKHTAYDTALRTLCMIWIKRPVRGKKRETPAECPHCVFIEDGLRDGRLS